MMATDHMHSAPTTTVLTIAAPRLATKDVATSTSMPSPLPSAVLLRGQKSIAIEHQGSVYRLQVTKLGKLILTK